MNFKARYNLAVEDADVLDNVEAEETVDVSEVIAAEEDLEEFNEAADQANEDIVAIEEAETVVDELEEQVEKNEAILANPEGGEVVSEPTVDENGEEVPGEVTKVEPISSEVVQASQEAYMNSLGRLGYKFEELKSNRLSVESIVADNVTALRLSTEGIKEMISNLITKIKEIFASVGRWIKRMFAKLAAVMSGTEKAAKALLAKAKDAKGEIAIKDEGKKEQIISKLGVWFLYGNGKLPVADVVRFISFLKPDTFAVNPNKVEIAVKKFDPINEKMLGLIGKQKETKDENGGTINVIYKVTGDSIGYNSVTDSFKLTAEIAQVEKKPDSISIDINKTLPLVIKAAAGTKAYVSGLDKMHSAMNAAIDAMAKVGKTLGATAETTIPTPDGKNMTAGQVAEFLKSLRVLGSKCITDSMFQYMNTLKAIVSACNAAYAEKGGAASGDGKEAAGKASPAPADNA